MLIVRVKDRGRDIAVHQVERMDEAREIGRVYELLGYLAERIHVEERLDERREAA